MSVTRRLAVVAIIGVVLAIVAELVVLDRARLHATVPYGAVLGFWAAFGLVWCVALVVGSKWVGHFLVRERDPYAGERPAEQERGDDRDG